MLQNKNQWKTFTFKFTCCMVSERYCTLKYSWILLPYIMWPVVHPVADFFTLLMLYFVNKILLICYVPICTCFCNCVEILSFEKFFYQGAKIQLKIYVLFKLINRWHMHMYYGKKKVLILLWNSYRMLQAWSWYYLFWKF